MFSFIYDFLELIACNKKSETDELINKLNPGSIHSMNGPSFQCFAYVVTSNEQLFIAHCNNIGAYFEANKAVFFHLLPIVV